MAGDDAATAWAALDGPWQEAFRQAWAACISGSIGVGAVLSDRDGRIVAASRNRVGEPAGPSGEVYGSTVAHAELNVLATVPFRSPRELTLSTTLQPCLQCSAAIRMGPVRVVRMAGADPLWDGCHDFSSLSPWVGRRPPVPVQGPMSGPVGSFATLLSRFGLGLIPEVEDGLRTVGHGAIIDLARQIERDGRLQRMSNQPVETVLADLYDDLREVAL